MESELRAYCKQWIHDNMCDGEDRSHADKDTHFLTSKDLYEMVDDMLEDYERLKNGEEDE